MCELGTLAAGKASESGLKNAIWYGTDFDISSRASTGDPIATKAGQNIWQHIVCVGQTITYDGETSSTTMFYYNGTYIKTLRYKCETNVYAIGNTVANGAMHQQTGVKYQILDYISMLSHELRHHGPRGFS